LLAAATFAAGSGSASAQSSPTPAPTATPLTVSGFFRSYYFTRQNASNNPGARFNFTPGAKYVSNGVNQASLNDAIDLHADYRFPASGWYVGGTYLYANPLNGPCASAANHANDAAYPSPGCKAQIPPNQNPDDSLPGFALSTLYEAYLAYARGNVSAKIGDQVFTSPWAGPMDTRMKPAAFQGADVSYAPPSGLTLEGADMIQYQPRTSSAFTSSTLLTSYPAGNLGIPSNINWPGGGSITTPGFIYGKAGYASPDGTFSADLHFWGVSDIVDMSWADARYSFARLWLQPYVALQAGWENNAGTSYIGKIDSSLFGFQVGANVATQIVLSAGYDEIPWRYDTIALPANVTCSNTSYQITAKGATLPYFLPLNAGQCLDRPGGTTTIAYGGWASPYADSSNPLFTGSISQGMGNRRAPGQSWRIAATYTSGNGRLVFLAADAWYDYSNLIAAQRTAEWNLDGTYRFMRVPASGPYHGLQLRYRYAERTFTDTYCGAAATNCAPGTPVGTAVLGGLPIFKYNRFMLEYDF
jgi:hypothetical protein